MKLIILYNNTAKEAFKSGWGFSCLISNDSEKILFDTGAGSKALLYNMNKLNINPNEIDKVVISHRHFDHTGGLKGFLREVSGDKPEILWPDNEQSFEISKGIYSTGALSSGFFAPKEQSLIIETSKGLVVLVGCSHPGVDNILQAVRKIKGLKSNEGIYAVIGGFHGFNKLDELKGIKFIGACHCTQHLQEIKEKFPQQFREINAGDVIEI